MAEVADRRCSTKLGFLKVLQNSQEIIQEHIFVEPLPVTASKMAIHFIFQDNKELKKTV